MLLPILLAQLIAPPQLGNAGVYGYPGDRWDNGQLACRQRAQYGVAHRTLPCGTRVVICSKRCVVATAIDRGPFGALDERGRYVVRRHGLRRGDRGYRGALDLRPETADAIGLDGYGVVIWKAEE